MESAMVGGSPAWPLPPGIRRLSPRRLTAGETWDLLILPPECEDFFRSVRCRRLLLPGGRAAHGVEAEQVISYGLSGRDSLTLSGIQRPTLCVQRALPGSAEAWIEPQEFPLEGIPGAAEGLLALLGCWLLTVGHPYFWREANPARKP